MLFWIVLSNTASFNITPRPELPEITLRSAALGRPMTLFDASWSMTTPNELALAHGVGERARGIGADEVADDHVVVAAEDHVHRKTQVVEREAAYDVVRATRCRTHRARASPCP